MKKWMPSLLAMALLVMSAVSQGCSGSGKWTVTTSADGQGTVSPAGVSSWDDGDVVTVEVTPDPFWKFDEWSGDASGSNPELILDVDRNYTLVAHFSPYHQTDSVINETFGIAPGEHYARVVVFYVGAVMMHDVTVSGTFAVTSTSPGDQVEVLILDNANQTTFYSGGSWTALYRSGETTAGTLDVPITTAADGATPFYLAFVGDSPAGPSVTVQANIDLKYTRRS